MDILMSLFIVVVVIGIMIILFMLKFIILIIAVPIMLFIIVYTVMHNKNEYEEPEETNWYNDIDKL